LKNKAQKANKQKYFTFSTKPNNFFFIESIKLYIKCLGFHCVVFKEEEEDDERKQLRRKGEKIN